MFWGKKRRQPDMDMAVKLLPMLILTQEHVATVRQQQRELEARTEQRIQDLENKLWKLQERLDRVEGIR